MALLSVEIEGVRCIERARLELDSHSTLISGPNGSGKSSILEAIFLLGRGRSFRARRLDSVIRQGSERLRVVGRVERANHAFTVGVEVSSSGTTARIGGEPASSLASLSAAFPVQIIEPGIHKLIEEGPVQRRRFLDWGVFHVEHQYLQLWQRFNRALKQRNAALNAQVGDDALEAWNIEFAEAGQRLTEARRGYLEQLQPHVSRAIASLLNEQVSLEYYAGWSEERTLQAALDSYRKRDRQRKTSTAGAHRADLIFKVRGEPAKQVISRGQQKLLATALLLAQLKFHIEYSGLEPTLLLDDPAAELDAEHLRCLVAEVEQLGVQLVITSLNPDFTALGRPGAMFHVEQGQVESRRS